MTKRRTMVRMVDNEWFALLMCNAMESHGGVVHSVVYVPLGQVGPKQFHQEGWRVFALIDEDEMANVDPTFARKAGL